MSNRREFIQAGSMALATFTLASADALSAMVAPAGQTSVPLYTAVFDDRFAPSVEFARRAQRLGLRTRNLDKGDVTRLWYDDLYHRWRQGPAAIAGLTTPDALFVLETFGNDIGLRLRFKVEHRIGAGQIEHQLFGPESLVQQAGLAQCGAGWASRTADLVSSCSTIRETQVDAKVMAMLPSAVSQQPLVSWLLAPAQRHA